MPVYNEEQEKESKCKRGKHEWGSTTDPRYQKCWFCNEVKKIEYGGQ